MVAIDTGFVQQIAHIAVDADKESLGQELHISQALAAACGPFSIVGLAICKIVIASR